MSSPSFSSLDEAHHTLVERICALCDTYNDPLQSLIQVIQRMRNAALNTPDYAVLEALVREGEDHAANLQQLKKTIATCSPADRGILLETSAEVLALVMRYLNTTPETVEKTALFQSWGD
jgi:hypothetical protein